METDGVATSNGLMVLDIVKHAIKTVIHMLKEGGRLAIAAFSDSATTPFELAHMTAGGKDDAVRALDGLRPDGQTNIWAGLVAGMEALRAGGVAAGRQQTVLLLTDGRPNIVPPKGHLRELGNYKDSHPGFTFQLNTFGFGYQLNSELLLDLATEGHGTFAFIPDAAIVGTTFVDSVANTLSALSQSATLNLLPLGGAAFQGLPMGGDASAEESWGQLVRLGPLQFGQSREVVVPMRIPAGMGPYLEAILEVPKVGGGSERVSVQTSERVDSQAAVAAKLRGEAVRIGYQAIKDASAGDVAEAQETVKLFAAEVGAVATDTDPSRHHPCLMALQKDVEGRMTKALDGKQRFNRWGKHYLRALCRAHQLQLCTNFMDPGLQTYGGSLFTALRKEGDEVFLSLPLPKPAPRANWLTGSPAHRFTGSPAHRLAHRLTGSPAGGYAAPSGYAAPATPQRAPSPDTRDYYGGCSGG